MTGFPCVSKVHFTKICFTFTKILHSYLILLTERNLKRVLPLVKIFIFVARRAVRGQRAPAARGALGLLRGPTPSISASRPERELRLSLRAPPPRLRASLRGLRPGEPLLHSTPSRLTRVAQETSALGGGEACRWQSRSEWHTAAAKAAGPGVEPVLSGHLPPSGRTHCSMAVLGRANPD